MPPNIIPEIHATNQLKHAAEHDIRNFPTDFLQLRIKATDNRLDLPSVDQWDDFIISTAANYDSSPVTSSAACSAKLTQEIAEICGHLVDIFGDLPKYRRFLGYRDKAAQDLLDLLQKLLFSSWLEERIRIMFYVALFRLCRKSELYPSCFTLTNVVYDGGYPVRDGHFGDVHKGLYGGNEVCLKVVKMYTSSDQSLLYKAFFREAVLWGQLSHINVLPFYGIYRLDDSRRRICLVSPWLNNGNINEYLDARPNVDRRLLIKDVASGIRYLHDNGVVHGDLKGVNILISNSGRAAVADFGLSSVTDTEGLKHPDLSSNNADGGTIRFQAPELIDPEGEDVATVRRTKASDIYAFSLVCYEIFTGNHPFPEVKRNYTVMLKVGKGERPQRPSERQQIGLTDNMWKLMQECWAQLPEERPTASQVLRRLPRVVDQRPDIPWPDFRPPGFVTSSESGEDGDTTFVNALPHLEALVV